MKYYVIEDDELTGTGEETIYVFYHTKKDYPHEDIHSLEGFAAKCLFIENRNSHCHWYKGIDVKEIDLFKFEQNIKKNLEPLIPMDEESYNQVKEAYEKSIKPFKFPNKFKRCASVGKPEWNNKLFVVETEKEYFALSWFKTT